MTEEATVIEARGLTRRYGAFTAVDGIDFEVREGECVGFLGPNGAGKTTTVRMLSGFIPISAGRAHVLGLDVTEYPREVKAQMGICAQEDNLDPDFRVEKNLLVYARYFGIPTSEARRRAGSLLALLQLDEKRQARIDELSGGMKRRLALARALLNAPRVLLLDEPTTGLDPQARHLIWRRVERLLEEGTTVLLTTHYMEEAATLCHRVILMDRGRILLEGEPARLVEQEVGREVLELRDASADVRAHLEREGLPFEEHEERLYVYLPPGSDAGRRLTERFPHQHHWLRPATLEDVFLRRAGRVLRD